MIRAVFFDFYNTLVYFTPPREELHATACQELGLAVTPQALRPHLPAADEFYHREALRLPPSRRSPEEQHRFFIAYEQTLLRGAGLEVSDELAYQVVSRVRQRGWKLALYPDAVPVVEELRRRDLVVGVVSNVDRDIRSYCQELGIADKFHFLVTSWEVGVGKPDPAIFRRALEYAGVTPGEAIHIGDQYGLDVVGARGVGIKGILLDRDGASPGVDDCPRIQSLWEVREHLTP